MHRFFPSRPKNMINKSININHLGGFFPWAQESKINLHCAGPLCRYNINFFGCIRFLVVCACCVYLCTEVIILVARWQPHPNVAMVRGSIRWG